MNQTTLNKFTNGYWSRSHLLSEDNTTWQEKNHF